MDYFDSTEDAEPSSFTVPGASSSQYGEMYPGESFDPAFNVSQFRLFSNHS